MQIDLFCMSALGCSVTTLTMHIGSSRAYGGAPITLRDSACLRPGCSSGWRAILARRRLERQVQARHDARTPFRFSRISIARCTGLARSSASSGVSVRVSPRLPGDTCHGPRSLRHRTFGEMASESSGRREHWAVIVSAAQLGPVLGTSAGRKILSERGREIVIGTDESARSASASCPVTDPRTVKNRVRLSLTSGTGRP